MTQQLANTVKITRVKNAVAAGQTTQQSDAVDMANFEGVVFLTLFGAITGGGVQSVKIQQSATAGLAGTETDLEGTGITVADDDDNQIVVHDIYRPTKRYVNAAVLRATQDSVIDGIIAIQYGASVIPTTNDATTVVSRETHVSPAEGTA